MTNNMSYQISHVDSGIGVRKFLVAVISGCRERMFIVTKNSVGEIVDIPVAWNKYPADFRDDLVKAILNE